MQTFLVSAHLTKCNFLAQAYPCPHQFLIKGNFRLGRRNLWEERSEGLDQVEESYCEGRPISILSPCS